MWRTGRKRHTEAPVWFLTAESLTWISNIMWNMFFLVLMLLHSRPRETTCSSSAGKVQFLEIKPCQSTCRDTVASHNNNNQTPCCLCHVVFKSLRMSVLLWHLGVSGLCLDESHSLFVCTYVGTHTQTPTPCVWVCVCLHLYYPRWNAHTSYHWAPFCRSPHKNVTDVKHAQSAGSTRPVRWVVSTQDPVNEEFILSIMSVCCPWYTVFKHAKPISRGM